MASRARRFEFVMVADSDDARLFVELSSYAADLAEAHAALELALGAVSDDEARPGDAQRALVTSAALAYCRTFFPSRVRQPMTAIVEVPDGLSATHDLIVGYRNRTVAHSQSDLSVTYAVGVLDSETLDVLDVAAPTISSPMPTSQVRSFLQLVDLAAARLDEVLEPIRARLVREVAATDVAALLREGRRPAVRVLPATEFSARHTRARYPLSHPVYVELEHDR